MVVKMTSSNGGSLAVLAGSEAGNGSSSAADVGGTDVAVEACSGGRVEDDIADHSDDEQGGDAGSDDSDSMDFDDDDEDDGSDLMSNTTLGDDITAQLAAAGPVGMAAAAAINSSKKRKRPHSFETNPSIRRRQQTRLLRKLRQTIDEYATRVGQQAIVLIATPGKPQNNFRVFGAKPLEDVVKNVKSTDLETALAHHAPPPALDDPSLYELPPLVIDGIPTPVEKMTQAQLRAFIPLMLKFSTGRGKPGWGKESTRPPWWPGEVPWANVRMDARPEDDKQRVSWTHALRQIVINCYKYHGREDLLPAFLEDSTEESNRPAKVIKTESEAEQQAERSADVIAQPQQQQEQQQQQPPAPPPSSQPAQHQQQQSIQQLVQTTSAPASQFAPTVVQTISNPDGTVSIIQVDPNNPIITLPDGTTAQVVATQGVATVNQCDEDDSASHDQQQQHQNDRNHHLMNSKPMIWQFVPTSQITGVTGSDGVTTLTNSADGTTVTTVDLSAVTESTIGQEGQHHILLTGEDGQSMNAYPVSVSGMITVPAMYQAMVANISQMGQTDASVQVLGPLISSLPKSDSNGGDDGAMVSTTSTGGTTTGGMNVGGLSVTPMLALGPNGTQQHILQVIDINQSRTTAWLTVDGQQVTAAPMVTSQLLGEVDSSILASAMQQVTSGDVVDLQETSPSSNSE
uniref:EOG090X02DX n=1 Tax=Daphnia barbata TaxID=414587 RepID=A0A4Y7LYQ6_9CRUS|nr:EOG090X02DX [Daphnia barbata]